MEPAQGDGVREDGEEAPAASPKSPQRKRGRRADPLRAPPTYLRRLANDLAREAMERAEDLRAANQGQPAEPLFPRQPRRMTEAEALAVMVLTPSQKRRRRTAELKKERKEKAAREAALLAFVEERRVAREAAAKRAVELKAAGKKLTYIEWRATTEGG